MENKKGISLITMVITIIVMIIISGAIVLTLSSTDIISKSSDATKATDLASIKELVDVAWADAYASGARKSTELKAIMQKKLEEVDLGNYSIKVSPYGAEVSTVEESKRKSGMYVVEAEINEYGFYYDYAYSINLGMISLGSGIPITKLGFVPRADGTVDVIVSLPVIFSNKPILIDIFEFIDLINASNSSKVDVDIEYVDKGLIIHITNTDSEGNVTTSDSPVITFADDGMAIPLNGGEGVFGTDLALGCDFNKIHEIYRDKVYMGVADTENGYVQIKAEYSSDGIFTIYDSYTKETKSVEAKVLFGALLMSDIKYTEDGTPTNGKVLAIISADGEYLMLGPADDSITDGMPTATLKLVNN